MTSKIIVNNIEADTGINTITFNNDISSNTVRGNIISDGTSTFDVISGVSTIGVTTAHVTSINNLSYPTAGGLSNRRININGAMQVAQRGTSFTGVNATAYHCDRYEMYHQNSGAAFTVTQSTDTPDGFAKSLKIDVTTADTSIASNEEIKLVHKIEGFDVQNIIKGTSSAVPLTLSFYAKATKTGTYIVELYDRDNNRDVSASYTISDTNWNRYELNYPADTGGSAFDDNNESSLEIQFWLVAGSAVQGGTLNTSWRTSSDGSSATGQINFTDSTDNDWLITGIQLEIGERSTPFEHKGFGEELARCQRYHQRINSSAANSRIATAGNGSPALSYPTTFLRTTMRSTPTIDYSTVGDFWNEGLQTGKDTVTALSLNIATTDTVTMSVTASGGNGTAQGTNLLGKNSNAYFSFDAEL